MEILLSREPFIIHLYQKEKRPNLMAERHWKRVRYRLPLSPRPPVPSSNALRNLYYCDDFMFFLLALKRNLSEKAFSYVEKKINADFAIKSFKKLALYSLWTSVFWTSVLLSIANRIINSYNNNNSMES